MSFLHAACRDAAHVMATRCLPSARRARRRRDRPAHGGDGGASRLLARAGAAADRAVGRTPDGSQWKLEDGLDPYAGTTEPLGTGCSPTPGLPNSCGVTAVARSSWGRLKAIYR